MRQMRYSVRLQVKTAAAVAGERRDASAVQNRAWKWLPAEACGAGQEMILCRDRGAVEKSKDTADYLAGNVRCFVGAELNSGNKLRSSTGSSLVT